MRRTRSDVRRQLGVRTERRRVRLVAGCGDGDMARLASGATLGRRIRETRHATRARDRHQRSSEDRLAHAGIVAPGERGFEGGSLRDKRVALRALRRTRLGLQAEHASARRDTRLFAGTREVDLLLKLDEMSTLLFDLRQRTREGPGCTEREDERREDEESAGEESAEHRLTMLNAKCQLLK